MYLTKYTPKTFFEEYINLKSYTCSKFRKSHMPVAARIRIKLHGYIKVGSRTAGETYDILATNRKEASFFIMHWFFCKALPSHLERARELKVR